MTQQAVKNSVGGKHTPTQPLPRMGRERRNRWPHPPGSVILDEFYDPDLFIEPSSRAKSPWPRRYRDAFNWFGLVLTYVTLSMIVIALALVGTKGLILIWEAWLNDLGTK